MSVAAGGSVIYEIFAENREHDPVHSRHADEEVRTREEDLEWGDIFEDDIENNLVNTTVVGEGGVQNLRVITDSNNKITVVDQYGNPVKASAEEVGEILNSQYASNSQDPNIHYGLYNGYQNGYRTADMQPGDTNNAGFKNVDYKPLIDPDNYPLQNAITESEIPARDLLEILGFTKTTRYFVSDPTSGAFFEGTENSIGLGNKYVSGDVTWDNEGNISKTMIRAGGYIVPNVSVGLEAGEDKDGNFLLGGTTQIGPRSLNLQTSSGIRSNGSAYTNTKIQVFTNEYNYSRNYSGWSSEFNQVKNDIQNVKKANRYDWANFLNTLQMIR